MKVQVLDNLDAIWRALISYAQEPMAVIDVRGVIVFTNDSALRLVGRVASDRATTVDELVLPEDRNRVRDVIDRTFAGLDPSPHVRFHLIRPEGRSVPIEASLHLVDTGNGRFCVIHARDVTEREHLEARLRHAQKLNLLGRLASGLADDFEQVVATIRGHLPAILERAAERPALLGVHAMVRATEKAAALTRQLRAFVETTPLWLERVDAHAVLGDIRRTLGDQVWITENFGASRPTVRADRSALTTGLRDLLLSIRHEMPAAAALSISTRNEGEGSGRSGTLSWTDHLVVEINNTGGGPTENARFFEGSFVTPAAGGIMLALVILDDIIGPTGGWIEVAAGQSGETVVRLFLPAD